jgi:hypothetical protein
MTLACGMPGIPGIPRATAWAQPAGEERLEDVMARTRAAYQALLDEVQPAAGDDALPLVVKAAAEIRVWNERAQKAGGVEADFEALLRESATPAQRETARRAIADLEAAGVGDMIARAAEAPRAMPTLAPGLLLETKMPHMGDLRLLTRLNVGRAMLAVDARDNEAFVARVDEMLRLGVHASRQGPLIAALVGYAIQARAFEVVRRAILADVLDDGTISRLDALIDERDVAPLTHVLRAEQILAEDATEYVYFAGSEGVAVLGRENTDEPLPPVRRRMVPDGTALGKGMPDRATQLRVTREAHNLLRQAAELCPADPMFTRHLARARAITETNLLLEMLTPGIDRAIRGVRQFESEREGVRTLLAIARHTRATGAPPLSLDELVPAYLPVVPLDPYTGKRLGYLPPPKGPYEGGRRFVLYSAGWDGRDDGGKVDFAEPFRSQRPGAAGLDFLLNRETPRKELSPR